MLLVINMARIPMDREEIKEARKIGMPEVIVNKMVEGIEPNEKEKEVIKRYGKVYVGAYKKENVWVKPQLRDFWAKRMRKYEVTVIFGGFRFDKHQINARDKKSARKKTKNQYKKKFQKDVSISSIVELGYV